MKLLDGVKKEPTLSSTVQETLTQQDMSYMTAALATSRMSMPCHFLVDPLSVEPDLCEVGTATGPVFS